MKKVTLRETFREAIDMQWTKWGRFALIAALAFFLSTASHAQAVYGTIRKEGGDLHVQHSNAGVHQLSTASDQFVTQFDMTNKSHLCVYGAVKRFIWEGWSFRGLNLGNPSVLMRLSQVMMKTRQAAGALVAACMDCLITISGKSGRR